MSPNGEGERVFSGILPLLRSFVVSRVTSATTVTSTCVWTISGGDFPTTTQKLELSGMPNIPMTTDSLAPEVAVYEEISKLARVTADQLQGPADAWMLRPAVEFEQMTDRHIRSTTGELRLCLAFLQLLIRDVMGNLSGDVPYEAFRDKVDIARANVQRAIRATLHNLAEDLSEGQRFHRTLDSCSRLAGEYASAIATLNQEGEY